MAAILDLATGEIRVAGIGDIGLNGDIENKLNWAPRVGVTYQLDSKTVLRAGYGRSYDLGVFGSLFGHSVTQNLPVLSVQELNAPENFDRVFTLAQGPPPPVFPAVPSNGRFPLPNGVFARALPEKQRPPTVDAFNVIVQRQLTNTMSVEAGYVGNRGRNVFAGDGPAINVNQPTLDGYPNVPQNNRRPFFAGGVPNDLGLGGAFGWTQGIDFFCNCANNAYDSLQAEVQQAVLERVFREGELHVAAAGAGERGLLHLRRRDEQGAGRLGPHAQLRPVARRRAPDRARQTVSHGCLSCSRMRSSAAGSSTRTRSSRAGSRSASTTGTREPTATRAATTGRI